jgi:hypothetical protein
MAVGSELPHLGGYPFEVRYSEGALVRARAAADVAAEAYSYFSRLFAAFEPDIAVVVAGEADWPENGLPYGLPFFRDDAGEIRPGVVVMPAGAAVHELGHAFEGLGDLRLPTRWLGEIFVNLALHAFGATRLPADLQTLEVLPTVGAGSRRLAARMRAAGYTTLEELEAHYPGSDESMSPSNYVWFQYRWLRLAAKVFESDGEDGLVRLWECFHSSDRADTNKVTAASLAPLLETEVSRTLGRAVRDWR